MAAATLDSRALPQSEPGSERPAKAPGIAAVYEANFRYVWRCLRSLGVRDGVLDDALQDVFMIVQTKLNDFDGRAELRTWLYAIALRVGRRYRYGSQRQSESLDSAASSELPAPYADGERALEQSEQLELARTALNALDDEKREVFVLAQIEQMSAPEIAEIIGIPVNTVYSRLRAARQVFVAEVSRLQSRPRRSR